MSSVVVTPVVDTAAPPRRFGIPGLRGTGVIGHVAAAVIVLAAIVAVFGSWLTPHDPDQILRLLAPPIISDAGSQVRLRTNGET